MTDEPPKPKLRRGFAVMSPERQRQIASLGGKGQRPESRPYARDRALAREAGRKGGEASAAARKKPPTDG